MARLRNITTVIGFAGVPVGTIVPFGASAAPGGWLFCDGSAISRTTFATLFAAINTIHGAGDGVTTFNIPDIRQRFILGKAVSGTGSVLGTSGGTVDHNHSIPSHFHGMGTGSDLNITSSGNHTISIDHDHGAITSSAGSAHSHANTFGIVSTDINHQHSIDHDHVSFNSTTESNFHTHTGTTDNGTMGQFPGQGSSAIGNTARVAKASAAGGNENTYTGWSNLHTHNFTTSNPDSTHVHGIDVPNFTGSSGFMASNNVHGHSMTGGVSNESAHTHSIDLPNFVANSSSNGAHSHANSNFAGRIGLVTGGVDGNSGMTSGTSNPPFYVLNHIIKH